VKLPHYAAAGIPEYWIANLKVDEVLAFRDPADGAYGLRSRFGAGTPSLSRHFQIASLCSTKSLGNDRAGETRQCLLTESSADLLQSGRS
jgi:hypothetical protein